MPDGHKDKETDLSAGGEEYGEGLRKGGTYHGDFQTSVQSCASQILCMDSACRRKMQVNGVLGSAWVRLTFNPPLRYL